MMETSRLIVEVKFKHSIFLFSIYYMPFLSVGEGRSLYPQSWWSRAETASALLGAKDLRSPL